MKRTYLALLQYDGGKFVGWQRQTKGRSVQGVMEGVLGRIHGGTHVVAHGAGRTDAGVHALGMAVSFSAPREWEPERLERALNALLPEDCRVSSVAAMVPGFHARKSATGRRYRYDIGTDRDSSSPFRRRYEWALGLPLDRQALESAAAVVRGTHDFRPFAAKTPAMPHYRCTVRRAEWEERTGGAGVSFHIEGDRFLHHMVRFLVGTMVDVALGRRPNSEMQTLLARTDNLATSPPAPPQGLFFVAAEYPAELYLGSSNAS
ncbi:MAG TPA: tRNA pseudouridine(38-40) synthase TruA [Gemmatimonadales bacterium]|nr:tRNA pseudouridine(38-40) synthase TruA [Gemmatimonadales bacterium]